MAALTLYVFLLLLVIFLYYLYSVQFSTAQLPPGPFTFPFGVGTLPSSLLRYPKLVLKNRPWEYMDALSKEHGDLFSMDVGGFRLIVVSSYELLQEIANMDEYSIKFSNEILTFPRTFNKELGLIFQGNPLIWMEMRKFTQRTLRDFGFGKRHTMQSAIEAETSLLIAKFTDAILRKNGVVSIRTNFVLPVLNVLWCMVAGKRYDHDDPNLLKLMEQNFLVTKSLTFADPLHLAFKWLEKIFPFIFKEDFRQKIYNKGYKFTKSLITERRLDGSYQTSAQNYIDVFLKQIEENKSRSKSFVYTDEQLLAMLADLLMVGTATTNGTLNYALLYLLLNADIQQKCQQEIDEIVPKHLTPTLDDIEKMPYFQAFILETHRLANVVPIPIPRIVPKNWKIRGYEIPKGTAIISNHYSVHMSTSIWKDPDVFRPERFLDTNGNFFANKKVIHFGLGKRSCIGKTLVNSVVPIFIASLIQHFHFSVVPERVPPTTEPETGVSLSPVEYEVYVTIRNQEML